jgi:hypothetical protein
MPGDTNPLEYRSKGDAVTDDVRSMHRSLRTWVMLWAVWAVGLVVWVGYLALIALIVLRLLA